MLAAASQSSFHRICAFRSFLSCCLGARTGRVCLHCESNSPGQHLFGEGSAVTARVLSADAQQRKRTAAVCALSQALQDIAKTVHSSSAGASGAAAGSGGAGGHGGGGGGGGAAKPAAAIFSKPSSIFGKLRHKLSDAVGHRDAGGASKDAGAGAPGSGSRETGVTGSGATGDYSSASSFSTSKDD